MRDGSPSRGLHVLFSVRPGGSEIVVVARTNSDAGKSTQSRSP